MGTRTHEVQLQHKDIFHCWKQSRRILGTSRTCCGKLATSQQLHRRQPLHLLKIWSQVSVRNGTMKQFTVATSHFATYNWPPRHRGNTSWSHCGDFFNTSRKKNRRKKNEWDVGMNTRKKNENGWKEADAFSWQRLMANGRRTNQVSEHTCLFTSLQSTTPTCFGKMDLRGNTQSRSSKHHLWSQQCIVFKE